jgi:general stress protein 26
MTHATKDELDRIGTLIHKARTALLTTVDEHGRLVSRPMVAQEREFDGDLWFFTEDPSHKTAEVRANPEVNVALESGKGWLSLSGRAEVVRDPARIDELWSASAQAWFEHGREDPAVALLKVTAHSAEYWTSDEPRPVVLLKYARAAARGGHPHVGSSRTVDLEG